MIENEAVRQAERSEAGRLSFSSFAIVLATASLLLFASATPAAAQASLGTAASFGVLAGTTVTNTGSTTVNGNVGVSPGSAVTGFPPGAVIGGSIHMNDATAIGAQTDLTTAYNTVAGTACTTDLSGQDLGGKTLTPGTYCFTSAAQLTGPLVLDALGNANAVFNFKIGSTLTTASGSTVSVINGGTTCNVFWQVGSSAILGTTTTFLGNILALTSITLNSGTTISGRALARNGAVSLASNNITVCGTVAGGGGPAPVPALSGAALLLLMAAMAAVGLFVLRR